MFQILNKIPRKVFVAVSGGIDSMVALDTAYYLNVNIGKWDKPYVCSA